MNPVTPTTTSNGAGAAAAPQQFWKKLPLAPETPPDPPVHVLDIDVTEKDIAEFRERGYWVGPSILDDKTVKLLRSEFERVFQGEVDFPCSPYEYEYWTKIVEKHKADAPDVRKINNAWQINAALRKIILQSDVVGRVASKLLGTPEIRLWHDQAIWKPSTPADAKSEAGNIGWHQDAGFWQISNTNEMITAWIPLQDTDLTNGGLRTIVGSHKWGLIPDSAKFFERNLDNLKSKFEQYATGGWVDEPCVMKAGQVAFHHGLTFHGSGPNTVGTPRLAYAIHMQPKNCGYAPGNGWHHNLKDIGPFAVSGTLFVGPNFPVLYAEPANQS